MFNFFFIWKHKKDVEKYIQNVFVYQPKKRFEGVRYALSVDEPQENIRFSLKAPPAEEKKEETKNPEISSAPIDDGVKYSDRDSGVLYSDRDSGVKYSTRETPSYDTDKFDAGFVSDAMRSYLQEKKPAKPLSSTTNLSFVEKLLLHIRQKDLFEPDVYKSAQMDRRLFSKIISNKEYQPSKDTVLALVFALKLSLDEAKDLLDRAGYTLSHSLKRDIIVEYFIKEKVYNLNNINAFLYNMNEKIIGRNY